MGGVGLGFALAWLGFTQVCFTFALGFLGFASSWFSLDLGVEIEVDIPKAIRTISWCPNACNDLNPKGSTLVCFGLLLVCFRFLLVCFALGWVRVGFALGLLWFASGLLWIILVSTWSFRSIFPLSWPLDKSGNNQFEKGSNH